MHTVHKGVMEEVQIKASRENQEFLQNDEIDNAIKTALLLIENDNLKMAGRVLIPLLPHTDKRQRDDIIRLLDPPLQIHFQKAYMLRLYEPEVFKEILERIVKSELHLLPAYNKALKMLENHNKNEYKD